MFKVILTRPDMDIKNYTLILPSVSVGNVGQLTVDLIINTLKDVTNIGYIHTAYLHPMIGAQAYDGRTAAGGLNFPNVDKGLSRRFGNLSTCCEVFASAEHRLVLIQQRTPIVKGKSSAYRGELLKWIREAHIGNIVLLASSFAHKRLDVQINDPFCRFVCTPAVDTSLFAKFKSELNWKQLEQNDNLLCNDTLEDQIVIPGGGIATSFYHESIANGMPLIILLKFCSEGDNIPDSLELASYLNEWLRITSSISKTSSKQSQWDFPRSWRLMYGGGPPSTIF